MDPITITMLALAVIGTATATYGSVQASAASARAQRAQQRRQSLEAQRERTKQIREARIRRAEVQNLAAGSGAGESSSAVTGASGALSQAFQGISYVNAQEQIGNIISGANVDIANAQGITAIGQGAASVAGTIFANRAEIGSIFGTSDTMAVQSLNPTKADMDRAYGR